MEYLIKKIDEPNKYLLLRRHRDKVWRKVPETELRIMGFFVYLQLTGQAIINDEIVEKPFPVDEEIEKALKILFRKF